MRPLVSVILTVYKRTQYLEAALDSVLAQSFDGYEVLVADDSGTSVARRIVAARGCPDRVKHLANPHNMGVVSSLRRAVGHARGDLIAILNDDDLWDRSFLAALVPAFDGHRACTVSFCDHWVIDEYGHVVSDLSDTWSAAFGRASLTAGPVPNPAHFAVVQHGVPIANGAVFRKNSVDWALVAPDVSGAYDYWIACLLASTRTPMCYVPKRLARYRVHAGMETLQLAGREDLVYIYSTMLHRSWFPELKPYLKSELASALYSTGRSKFFQELPSDARRDLWTSFTLSRRMRALAGVGATLLPRRAARYLRGWLRERSDRTSVSPLSATAAAWRLFRGEHADSKRRV
jgi:glycosyltransferase involved in cell wall biosynthesis